MKNCIFTLISFLGAVAAFVSCDAFNADLQMPEAAQEGTPVPLELFCEPLDTETGGVESRSLHDVSSLKKISNANYYLFKGGNLVKQEYISDMEKFAVTLPDKEEKYNLYIVTNIGEHTVSSDVKESAMATAVHMDYLSKDGYFSTIEENGFPMATIVKDFDYLNSGEISLKRLVHTLYVRISEEELSSTEMTFTSLKINQAPRDIYPFAIDSKGDYTITGDAANMDADEIKALNEGQQITLYVLESMRGELFPENTSWKKRVPDNIVSSDTDADKMCPYIELTASAQTTTSHYENNIYRAYLGTEVTDCNVRRSKYSTITNSFVNDMIVDEQWRIEGDTPVVNQTLAFVDTRYTAAANKSAAFKEVSSIKIMKGFTAEYYIYRSHPAMEYTISLNRASTVSPYVSYTTTKVDDYFTRIKITTTQPVNGSASASSVTFTIKSKDGMITDNLTCHVVDDPIKMQLGNLTDGIGKTHIQYLPMQIDNPLGLQIKATVTGTLGGYLEYCPNGTWWGNDEKTYTASINTTIRKVPSSFSDSFTLLEFNKSKAGNCMYDICKNYEWNATTWLNASNGYNKHATPMDLKINVKVEFERVANQAGEYNIYPTSSSTTVPLNIVNKQLDTKNTNLHHYGAGAGTDFGIMMGSVDDTYTDNSGWLYYHRSAYWDEEAGIAERIYATVNGTAFWTDSPPSMTYSGK